MERTGTTMTLESTLTCNAQTGHVPVELSAQATDNDDYRAAEVMRGWVFVQYEW